MQVSEQQERPIEPWEIRQGQTAPAWLAVGDYVLVAHRVIQPITDPRRDFVMVDPTGVVMKVGLPDCDFKLSIVTDFVAEFHPGPLQSGQPVIHRTTGRLGHIQYIHGAKAWVRYGSDDVVEELADLRRDKTEFFTKDMEPTNV